MGITQDFPAVVRAMGTLFAVNVLWGLRRASSYVPRAVPPSRDASARLPPRPPNPRISPRPMANLKKLLQ